jgi:hypothetical protein
MMVICGQCISPTTRFITSMGTRRARHHTRASVEKSNFRKLGVLELRDEHGRHAVHAGAAFVLNRLHGAQRVERRVRAGPSQRRC